MKANDIDGLEWKEVGALLVVSSISYTWLDLYELVSSSAR